ncbi:hypothetical protein QIH96_12890 [Bradyrhizobium japonicum]|uniref:hypothetical protein n=1 Tax=Bradyrhizobium japonicum TaxID=375 RepID=UPI00271541B2|nr:hypothetical protein [Bradyrhizobium japonicum]WLB65998.1 hypothetical protein QIH96_12890 [Bradyrhizobium japonicum]
MRLAGFSAPVPARAAPASPKITMVRAIPMIPELAFDDRWQAPAPAMQHARMAEDLQIKPDQPKAAQKPPRRAERHADRVCGNKGRRYFYIGRRNSCFAAARDSHGQPPILLLRKTAGERFTACCAINKFLTTLRGRGS